MADYLYLLTVLWFIPKIVAISDMDLLEIDKYLINSFSRFVSLLPDDFLICLKWSKAWQLGHKEIPLETINLRFGNSVADFMWCARTIRGS